MRVIPVIDLRGGIAVHARGGDRSQYTPVRSVLTEHSEDPLALARAYRAKLGTPELYVADLDAIAGRDVSGVAKALCRPGARVWLDAGVEDVPRATETLACGAERVVVGLETLASRAALHAVVAAASPERVALSVDLRDGVPLARADAELPRDPGALCTLAASLGVRCLILLDLARVGRGGGADVRLVREVRARLPDVELVAGGGIGGPSDLASLARAGCDAALVATALHDGRVTGEDVRAMRGQKEHGRVPGRGAR
jgi:phosphoribosylformimino-5-aminoimidazole carboxamide ribotide isomerase